LRDLEDHRCLQLITPGFPPNKWVLDGPKGEETITLGQSTYVVNVAEAMSVAVQEGMGIGVLPTSSALAGLRSGALKRVLSGYTTLTLGVYAMYPSRQYLDAKIRTWIEFLKEELPPILEADADAVRGVVTD
jgi:DNA-binding transcriptional LysR family regulator